MREYKPGVRCTFSDCLEGQCPIYNLVIGETIIEEVFGKGLEFSDRTAGSTYSRIFNVDGTQVKVTMYGKGPKKCGFRIRTEGPYEDKFLKKLKEKVLQNIPKVEVWDRTAGSGDGG